MREIEVGEREEDGCFKREIGVPEVQWGIFAPGKYGWVHIDKLGA